MAQQLELLEEDPYAVQPGWDGGVYIERATALHYCTPCRARFLEYRPNDETDVVYIRWCAGCRRDLLADVEA